MNNVEKILHQNFFFKRHLKPQNFKTLTQNSKKQHAIQSFRSFEVWVTFGGSYSGALSAWARKLYPELFRAAVAQYTEVGGFVQKGERLGVLGVFYVFFCCSSVFFDFLCYLLFFLGHCFFRVICLAFYRVCYGDFIVFCCCFSGFWSLFWLFYMALLTQAIYEVCFFFFF